MDSWISSASIAIFIIFSVSLQCNITFLLLLFISKATFIYSVFGWFTLSCNSIDACDINNYSLSRIVISRFFLIVRTSVKILVETSRFPNTSFTVYFTILFGAMIVKLSYFLLRTMSIHDIRNHGSPQFPVFVALSKIVFWLDIFYSLITISLKRVQAPS